MKPILEKDIYHYVTSYTKIYPDRIKHYVFDTPRLERIEGFESYIDQTLQTTPLKKTPLEKEMILLDSLRRTKTTISDIILCNQFDLFATFTFAKDRQNIDRCKERMSNWLRSQRKVHGSFKYLIVPEFHKDQKSLHFHALIYGYQGKLTETKKKIKGRKVYNFKEYKNGFTTAVKIDDISKVSSYVKKYITKDMPQFQGKKRYWVSKNLYRPIIQKNYPLQSNPFIDLNLTYEKKGFKIYETSVTLKTLNNHYKGKYSWNKMSTLPISEQLEKFVSSDESQPKQAINTELSLSDSRTTTSLKTLRPLSKQHY